MTDKPPKIDRAHAIMLQAEIGKVRCWLTGYEAGRGDKFNSIPGIDSLRMVQIFLKEITR